MRNMAHGLGCHVHRQLAKAALRVRQGAAHGAHDIRLRQGEKLKDPAPAHNRRRHGHHGIFRSGADEANGSPLNGREDAVALRFAPAVALVQQQIRCLSGEHAAFLGRLQHIADIGHAAGYRVQLRKGGAGCPGNNGSQRGFSTSWRPVKDGGSQPVRLNGPAQQPAFPHQMPLTDKFIQGARAHAVRQRGLVLFRNQGHSVPSVLPSQLLPGPQAHQHDLYKEQCRKAQAKAQVPCLVMKNMHAQHASQTAKERRGQNSVRSGIRHFPR